MEGNRSLKSQGDRVGTGIGTGCQHQHRLPGAAWTDWSRGVGCVGRGRAVIIRGETERVTKRLLEDISDPDGAVWFARDFCPFPARHTAVLCVARSHATGKVALAASRLKPVILETSALRAWMFRCCSRGCALPCRNPTLLPLWGSHVQRFFPLESLV